jgi:hypothetical protein
MRRLCFVLCVAAYAGIVTGCVERRYVITSDPPGAIVFKNGQPLGATPVDDHFVYYGKYKFTLVKDGYETMQVEQDIPSPWYEYFPIDFFSESIFPLQVEDVRRFNFKMEPRRIVNTNDLLRDAQNLRNRGMSIQTPVIAPAANAPVQTVPAPDQGSAATPPP